MITCIGLDATVTHGIALIGIEYTDITSAIEYIDTIIESISAQNGVIVKNPLTDKQPLIKIS